MISCAQYRTSINITINDIFADFSDPRKETLVKRVRLALEDLEIRMRNEVEGNNLANLQMLLKKQNAIKKLEEKVEEATEEIEEKRERDHFLTAKFTDMQSELNKSNEHQRHLQDKVRTLN
jgi:ATP-dependent Lon protease